MAVETGPQPTVIGLGAPLKSESLWMSSLRRLMRNRAAILGLVIIVIAIGVALFADVIAPKGYREQVLSDSNSAPQWIIDLFPAMISQSEGGYVKVNESYLLGADKLGRDIFSRILYGTQISLTVAFVGPLVAMVVGMTLGLIRLRRRLGR